MIETERLQLKPLQYEELKKYLYQKSIFEKELSLLPAKRTFNDDLFEILTKVVLPKVQNAAEDFLYYTLWVVIDKIEKQFVGDFLFKGAPNYIGQIEVGYGTYSDVQNKGYMTETISGVIEWAKTHEPITYIIAETEQINTPSIRVLEKNDFTKIGSSYNMFFWQRKV